MTHFQLNYFFLLFKAPRLQALAITLVMIFCFSMANANNRISNYTGETQTALGQAFINHLHQQYDIIQDPEINHYIRNIGKKIVQHTNSTKHFRFYVINNPDINAFAGPDGVIGIHTGLITSVTSEDELASVIAHEIAHVTQEHLYRRMVLQSESSLPQIASMIAAILIGIHDPNAGMATLMTSSAYQIEKQLKYSRQHEYEADFAGIKFLSLSGYNPYAMPGFFEKLANSYQHQGMSAPEILRTHPLTENRLAKAQDRAASLANDKQQTDDSTLELIQMRLSKLYKLNQPNSIKLKTPELNCYEQALNDLSASKNSFSSQQCLEQLISNNAQQYLLHTAYIQLQSKQNPDEKNIKDPQFSYELFPSNEAVVLRYADLIKHTKGAKKALTILERFSETTEYKYRTESMISKLYMDADRTAYSYYHLALAQLDIGNLKRASIFAEKAKNALSNTNQILEGKILKLQENLNKLLKSLNDE